MKYLVMIQARCGSTRLPNKVLKDLCGKPALQRMIERVQRSTLADEVMVVTSVNRENLPILALCASIGVRVGVGAEDDVLDRYYQTAKLIRPELLDLALQEMAEDTDYMGMTSESFADGLDLEIMKFSALERAWKEADHSFEREHVTQYIIRHPELFRLQNFESPVGYFGDHRWIVDEPEDFELVKKVYEHFELELGRDDFGYRDILDFMNSHPEIKALNRMYTRNEGLAKSIREDRIVEH